MPKLHVLPLADDELLEAYPLVRSSAHIGLDRWLAFARALVALEGGVLGARAHEGCLYGLAIFAPFPSLRDGRVLIADIIAAIEIGSASRIRGALCEGLEVIAASLDCRTLTTTGSGSSNLWPLQFREDRRSPRAH